MLTSARAFAEVLMRNALPCGSMRLLQPLLLMLTGSFAVSHLVASPVIVTQRVRPEKYMIEFAPPQAVRGSPARDFVRAIQHALLNWVCN